MRQNQKGIDYFNCKVYFSHSSVQIRERVYDPREEFEHRYKYLLIAEGFNSVKEAEAWLNEKRIQQAMGL
jgi:hypothetical protein